MIVQFVQLTDDDAVDELMTWRQFEFHFEVQRNNTIVPQRSPP